MPSGLPITETTSALTQAVQPGPCGLRRGSETRTWLGRDAAVNTAKALAAKEGLLTGISGGGTMYAALETAKKAPKGSVILAMLPDTGERYLSTPLFADIPADMNDEELSIAKSTPSFQLIPGQEPVLAA